MTELEQKLHAAMHAAVDDEQPPRDLTARVIRRYRRRTAIMASVSVATCAAVAIAVLLAILPLHGRVPIGPSPLGPGHPTTRLHGAPMPPGSDVRLLLSGNGIAWYSTATRRTVPVTLPGIPQGVMDIPLERAQRGYLVSLTGRQQLRAPLFYLADGKKVATRIGFSTFPAPSSDAREAWLVYYPNQGRPRAQLVSIDGWRIGGQVTLPANSTVMAGVGKYLLLNTPSYGSRGELWDPASRRVERAFGHVEVAGPEQVAWGRPCEGCQVNVLDTRTGSVTSIAIPRGWRIDASGVYREGDIPSTGAFSSDGRLLAVGLSSGTGRHGIAQAERLGVIDVATHRLLIVPGVDLTGTAAQNLFYGWQPGTRRLVVVMAARGVGWQVGYWQPGAARLRLTTAVLPQEPMFIYVQ
jgi:hypothetical protein